MTPATNHRLSPPPACDAALEAEPGRPVAASATAHATRLVAADWSGAARTEENHLRIAEYDVASDGVECVGPATRVQAADRLITLAVRDQRLVVGLDFSFSLPVWWLDFCGVDSAIELWSDERRLERWLQDCRPPFWGRPGRPRPVLAHEVDHWRCTELVTTPRPRSVFQIGGAGTVGTASLRGMPTLARLRHEGFSIWPFDPWSLPAVVEMWPRLAMGGLVKSRIEQRVSWLAEHRAHLSDEVRSSAETSDDAFDAVAGVLGLAARNGRERETVTDPVICREGWIDGVALPRL